MTRLLTIFLHNIDLDLIDELYNNVFKDYDAEPISIISDAARLTNGYPYLIQLVDYYLWGITDKRITKAKLDFCIKQSKQILFQNVHSLIYGNLSVRDQEFINAMCEDESVSKISDIMNRLDVTKGYISKYRQRLLDRGLIQREGRGELSFMLPFMKEFVLEQD
ncbi:MAG: hypothetical protein LBN22_04020 [Clostridiales Family XIII bacterium]|nr:hypothetical protein [Clostridiales Family XIII bacterium]